MKFRKVAVLAAILSALLIVSVAGAAALYEIGTPTLRVVNGGNAQTAVIYADGITNGGVANNGAIGWDIYLTVPNTVGINDFTVTAGSAWTSICPGTFNVSKVTQASTVAGQNAYLVSGVCLVQQTSGVTGSNIPVATLTFTSSCSATGNFDINLDTGPANDSTDMFDLGGYVYIFPSGGLTDGGSICGPTAVTMSGVSANSANPAAATSALPLVLGGAVVAAGGAYAFLRRKR